MTRLNIIQNKNTIEIVTQQIIETLYNIALTIPKPQQGETDQAYVSGHISVPCTYKEHVEYLAGVIGEGTSGVVTSSRQNASGRFQDLQIDVTNGYSIYFEDPNMLQYLLNKGIGSNGSITTADTVGVTSVVNNTNTTITKFNELKYFTSITESKGGWDSSQEGNVRFQGWTALEEVDISNFTTLGHNNGYGYGDTFRGCSSLKKVTASDKLEKIGHSAFLNCLNLEDITSLNGCISLYTSAFESCKKLKQSSIDNCSFILIKNDNNSIFKNCEALTSVTLAQGTTFIGGATFYKCSGLTTVTIPSSVTSIGNEAFLQCSQLTSVDISHVTSFDGSNQFSQCYRLSTVSLCNNLTYLPNGIFSYCSDLTTINIPSGLTRIGNSAFESCPQLSLDISTLTGNSIQYGARAFKDASSIYGNLVFASGTTFNDDGRIFEGTKITSADLSNTSITALPQFMFYNCTSLTTVTLPSAVTTLNQHVFNGCTSLSSIDLSNITTLEQQAFFGCSSLTSVNTGNLTTIKDNCFRDCTSLSSLSSTNSITYLGDRCFQNSGLSGNVSFSNLSTLGANTFVGCRQLTSIDFTGSTFTQIGSQMFDSCSQLHHVIINPTVTRLGSEMFKSCGNIAYVILKCSAVPVNGGIFSYNNAGFKVYVPDALLSDYQSDSGWSSYSNRIFSMTQFAIDYPNA